MKKRYKWGHALIVGVGGKNDLPHTVDDAEGISEILLDSGRCAYPEEQVRLLTGAKAKRAAVLKGLEALSQVEEDASVIVYFSGHGYRVGNGKKAAYYLMPNGYDIDRLKQTAISGAEFAERLSDIKAKRLLVMLDCCHAGGFSGVQALPPGAKAPKGAALMKAPLPPEAERMFGSREGRIIIASSTGSEVSFAGEPYSAFTTALIAALCGEGAAKEDGYVRVMDLALYTREAVVALTEKQQHPTADFEKADNFAVAYYAGGEKKRKGLSEKIKEPRIETRAGANEYRVFDQRDWNVIGNVTNMRDQYNVSGDMTKIDAGNIGFFQPGWKVNSVTQIQEGNRETQRADEDKRRR
jgi:hypothetical protein